MADASSTDVVVVGAGIAGVGAAWALAADLDVVVVEQEDQPGTHATGRSAAVISETSGTFELCALAALSRPFFADPPASVSDCSLLSPRGLLWVTDDRFAGRLADIEAVAERLGVACRRLDPPAVVRLVPELRVDWVSRGLLEPEARAIDVAALMGGWIRDLRRRGGRLLLSSAAVGLRPEPGGWVVSIDAGPAQREIRCRTVVNAAGAWADEVAVRAGLEPLGLQPWRRTAFVFPGPAGIDLRARPLVMDVGSRFYFEPEGPGWLASPADETASPPTDARVDPLDIARAVDALAEATTLEVRGVRRSWAGLRTFAPDRRPVVGFDRRADGFFWLAGQGGGGIKTAPALAELARALIVDDRPGPAFDEARIDLARLAPGRFRTP